MKFKRRPTFRNDINLREGIKLSPEYLFYRAWRNDKITVENSRVGRKPSWVYVAEDLLAVGFSVWFYKSSNTGSKYLRAKIQAGEANREFWLRFANHPWSPKYKKPDFDIGYSHSGPDATAILLAVAGYPKNNETEQETC